MTVAGASVLLLVAGVVAFGYRILPLR